MKSITKAADELGVSRTKIYTLLKNLDIETKKISKENLISDEDFKRIQEYVLNEQYELDKENSDEIKESSDIGKERIKGMIDRDRNMFYGKISDREYSDLKERIQQLETQIDRKDQQLKEKDVQLNESLKANTINSQLNFMIMKTLPQVSQADNVVEVSVDKAEAKEHKSFLKRFWNRISKK